MMINLNSFKHIFLLKLHNHNFKLNNILNNYINKFINLNININNIYNKNKSKQNY